MPATESAVRGEAPLGASQATAASELDIVLKPLSRPELGEIRVDGVLAVGRAEQPFATYKDDFVVMLSRRHARIFCEAGVVYVADLGSSNGTTVNRAAVGQSPSPLRDGDEVCFGGVLSYRVEITPRTKARPDAFTLTLSPASQGTGLETLVITRFPFLVSKTEGALSRQPGDHAAQLSYLSRRHAHIFLKGGGAYIEDLGSTNGTFLDGLRLQECAVPLQDGALLAFGGDHFTYRVGTTQAAELDLPKPREPARAAQARPADSREPAPAAQARPADNRSASDGKTTFVAAPTSFLEIFCVENALDETADGNSEAVPAVADQAPARRSRGRAVALWSELASVFQGHDAEGAKRGAWWAAALVAVLVVVTVALYGWGASDRKLKELVAQGDYAQAAVLADRKLEQHPDDVELKALATEAALKANVPAWLAKVAAHDFDGAGAVIAGMSQLGQRNPELRPLVAELEWLGRLEQLVSQRGGPEKPIRIYADEDSIAALIDRWNNDTREHQRSLARIASYVPQFGAPYAEALTHVRKLQSEATVHLGAIERLKATIVAELKRDRPEALDPVLKEAAEKYPGLGGLDSVRQDLDRYIEIRSEARAGKPGRLFPLMLKARFATPLFQEHFRALAASGQAAAGRPGPEVRSRHPDLEGWPRRRVAGGPAADGHRSLGRSGCDGAGAPASGHHAVRSAAAIARRERLRGAAAGVSPRARSRGRRPLRACHAGRPRPAEGQVARAGAGRHEPGAHAVAGLSEPGRDRSLAAQRDRHIGPVPRQGPPAVGREQLCATGHADVRAAGRRRAGGVGRHPRRDQDRSAAAAQRLARAAQCARLRNS